MPAKTNQITIISYVLLDEACWHTFFPSSSVLTNMNASVSLITVILEKQHMMHLRAYSDTSRSEVTTCTSLSLCDDVSLASVAGCDSAFRDLL